MFPVTRIWSRSTLFGCSRSNFFERLLTAKTGKENQNTESSNIRDKPKKPMTAFFRYIRDVKPILVQENPTMKIQQITKLASELWKNESPEKKVKYENPYKEDMERFKKLKEQYLESLSPEARGALKAELVQKRTESKVKKLRKKAKESGKPKRPPSTFALFIKSTQEERIKNSKSATEWVSIQAKKWKTFSNEDKQEYIDESKRLALLYASEIKEWEAKMVSMGDVDVLRNISTLDLTKRSRK